jgi:Domain of Unknown Function (DUF1080)
MFRRILFSVVPVVFVAASTLQAADKPQQLFNGKDLKGWEGNPEVWSVEDGAIVGRTSAEKPIEHNTFLIWKDGKPSDFRLRLEYRIEGGNSGVQYRSKILDPAGWVVGGYQADIDSKPVYSGIMYEEQARGILAKRGERARIDRTGKVKTESIGDEAELQKSIHTDDEWNTYVIEAVGPRMRHTINGKLMSVTNDRDQSKAAKDGVIALQVHAGPPMAVRFRNIRLEKVDAKAEAEKRAAKKNKKEAKSEAAVQ